MGLVAAQLGLIHIKSEFYYGLVLCSSLLCACTDVSMGEYRIISPAQDCLFPCRHRHKSLWEHMDRQPIPSQQCPCGHSSGSVSPRLWCCHRYICNNINKSNQKFHKFGRYHSTKKNNTSISLLPNCSLLDSNITAEIEYYHRPELVLWGIRLWLNTSNSRHILSDSPPKKGIADPNCLPLAPLTAYIQR